MLIICIHLEILHTACMQQLTAKLIVFINVQLTVFMNVLYALIHCGPIFFCIVTITQLEARVHLRMHQPACRRWGFCPASFWSSRKTSRIWLVRSDLQSSRPDRNPTEIKGASLLLREGKMLWTYIWYLCCLLSFLRALRCSTFFVVLLFEVGRIPTSTDFRILEAHSQRRSLSHCLWRILSALT